jgi:hypothetical protein
LQQQELKTPLSSTLGSSDDATGIGIGEHDNNAGTSDR